MKIRFNLETFVLLDDIYTHFGLNAPEDIKNSLNSLFKRGYLEFSLDDDKMLQITPTDKFKKVDDIK